MSRTSPPKCFGELEQGTIFLYSTGESGVLSHGGDLKTQQPEHSKSAFQWDTQPHIPDVETEASNRRRAQKGDTGRSHSTTGTVDVGPLAVCCQTISNAPGSFPAPHELCVLVYTCCPCTGEAEAGGAGTQGHLWPHSKSETSLDYILTRPHIKESGS